MLSPTLLKPITRLNLWIGNCQFFKWNDFSNNSFWLGRKSLCCQNDAWIDLYNLCRLMNDHAYSRLCNSGIDLTFQLNLTWSYMLNPLSQLLFRINHSEIKPTLSFGSHEIQKSWDLEIFGKWKFEVFNWKINIWTIRGW